MGFIESVFGTIGTWFGFVGSCVVGPNATCRPFLAFVALAVAAVMALLLVLRAYRAVRGEDDRRVEERAARLRELRTQQRVRHAVAAHVAPRRSVHRGWRMPA
jgi:membrane protein implicated in regulation of membrane protease activity